MFSRKCGETQRLDSVGGRVGLAHPGKASQAPGESLTHPRETKSWQTLEPPSHQSWGLSSRGQGFGGLPSGVDVPWHAGLGGSGSLAQPQALRLHLPPRLHAGLSLLAPPSHMPRSVPCWGQSQVNGFVSDLKALCPQRGELGELQAVSLQLGKVGLNYTSAICWDWLLADTGPADPLTRM